MHLRLRGCEYPDRQVPRILLTNMEGRSHTFRPLIVGVNLHPMRQALSSMERRTPADSIWGTSKITNNDTPFLYSISVKPAPNRRERLICAINQSHSAAHLIYAKTKLADFSTTFTHSTTRRSQIGLVMCSRQHDSEY